MIRILVVDDHEVVRAGLVAVINMEQGMCVVGQARTGEDAVRLYRELLPDVTTMDLKMPGAGGCSAIVALRSEFPDAKILVLSSLSSDEHIYRALQAGALGYLPKDTESDELTTAIRSTHTGKRTIPAEIGAALTERLAYDPLSARELEVLRCVAKGRSNKEIGEDLGVSENSVKGYLKSIASKLDTPDRTAAVMLAVKRGLIEIESL